MNPCVPGLAVDGQGNKYILERKDNVIYKITSGSTQLAVWQTNILPHEAVSNPGMDYLFNEDALVVSTIETYDLWRLEDGSKSLLAHNVNSVDNFSVFETAEGDLLAMHSGQVFRLRWSSQ